MKIDIPGCLPEDRWYSGTCCRCGTSISCKEGEEGLEPLVKGDAALAQGRKAFPCPLCPASGGHKIWLDILGFSESRKLNSGRKPPIVR